MCKCRLPLVKLFQVCEYVRLKRGQAFGRGEAGGLWEIRLLIFNIGQEWSEGSHLALMATTPKDLLVF